MFHIACLMYILKFYLASIVFKMSLCRYIFSQSRTEEIITHTKIVFLFINYVMERNIFHFAYI